MNKQIVSFRADGQILQKTDHKFTFAANIVSYIEAEFDLGEDWDGFDAVRAVWQSTTDSISMVLDDSNKCEVPAEVLRYPSRVLVNLVGSKSVGGTLEDRLTTYPVVAFTIDKDAKLAGNETPKVSPNQFEQYVGFVKTYRDEVVESVDDAEEYSLKAEGYTVGTQDGESVESGQYYHNNAKYYKEQSASYASDAHTYASNASGYASQASASATTASGHASAASGSAGVAASAALSASDSASTATTKAGEASTSATAAAGSATTASQAATTAQAVLESIPEDYSTLSNDVSDLKEDFHGLTVNQDGDYDNIIDWSKIKHETLMWNAGTYQENDGYWSTDYTPVKSAANYVAYNFVSGNIITPNRTHAFDANKSSLGLANFTDGELTTPTGTAFLVMSFRYVHDGTLGTYNSTTDWDDNIGKMYINIGTASNKHAPYPYYLSDSIKIRHLAETSGRVIRINNAVSSYKSANLIINRSLFTGGSTITITVTKRNIFDGVIQSGYWNGSTVASSDTHSCSVNPTYVNGGEYIVTNGSCRITEFLSDGTYNTSAIAVSRTPYKVSENTNFIHFSALNDVASALKVYAGAEVPSTGSFDDYSATTISHTVRNWGTTKYNVPITLYDGYNSVFVAMHNSPQISLAYDPDINVINADEINDRTNFESLESFAGTKMAVSHLYTAHRGSTIEAPENTTFAIVQAFKNGFKNVEIDVRFTSDGIPVLLHDSTIDRTSNGTGSVSSFTYNQLQTYDFGSWMGKQFTGTRIPSLENACRLCRALNLNPHLDISASGKTETEINTICNILFKYGLLDGCVWYLNASNSGISYIENYYISKGAKFYAYYQVAGFGESSIVTLLNNINNIFRINDAIYDMGISLNITDLTATIKNTALNFNKRVPIAIYFVDSFEDYVSVYDYPYALYCTNRGDIPYLSSQFFAAGSIWA